MLGFVTSTVDFLASWSAWISNDKTLGPYHGCPETEWVCGSSSSRDLRLSHGARHFCAHSAEILSW